MPHASASTLADVADAPSSQPTLTQCSRALVPHRGRGKMFGDLDLTFDIYHGL